jgi:hypothetical protein
VVLANGLISLTAIDHHAGYRGRQYHFQRSARASLSGQPFKHFCRLPVQSNALLSSLFSCLLHAGALEISVSLPCSGGENIAWHTCRIATACTEVRHKIQVKDWVGEGVGEVASWAVVQGR